MKVSYIYAWTDWIERMPYMLLKGKPILCAAEKENKSFCWVPTHS